jgi:hypothetical protein
MGWLSLMMAGALEIVWILALKYSDGFSRLVPSLVMLAAIALSFALLGLSLRSVPFGTACHAVRRACRPRAYRLPGHDRGWNHRSAARDAGLIGKRSKRSHRHVTGPGETGAND